ncbi:amine oxidase [Rhodococcus opacus M213]|uniref:Amine oxidase n=1 Tax=Rhodococcus opacus M213 TaxID=1129896 RepID=K8XJZ6_RHOOP|nr:NAD(P)/FAD-dependent oxidoreductase [Rhodococcus opacus]EKT81739.1 amine oxidase [Rhodococcus opacus M213]
MASDPIDVIVVGGGLAGVTAARDLAQTGLRTLLVEARDRLGGRTAMQTLAGQQVDTGGAYFHWFQAAIWREVTRYELPVVESGLATAGRWLLGASDGIVELTAEEFDAGLRRVLTAFCGDPKFGEALVRPFAVHTDPGFALLDDMSVEDRLQQLRLDPRDDSMLRAVLADFGPPADVSLGWVLQRLGNGVWSYEAMMALFASYRLERGMGSLVDAMVADADFEVRLSSPVTAIEYDAAGARVVLHDGSELTARAVVLATPVNVWKTITFTPELSQAHQAATREGVAAPQVSQLLMHVRGVSEAVIMFAPFDAQPFDLVGTHSMLEDGQLLHGFSFAGEVTCAGGHAQVAEALRKILPEAELVDFVGHDWFSDPYALGGHGSMHPGQAQRFLDILDQPLGSLFIASADIAPQFSGMLTGAIESGARAARRATLALASPASSTPSDSVLETPPSTEN